MQIFEFMNYRLGSFAYHLQIHLLNYYFYANFLQEHGTENSDS